MSNKSFKEVSELWKSDKKQYVKVSTFSAYALILENHLVPAFGQKTEISEKDVQEFVMQSLDGGLSQKTVHDFIVVLKMVVRFGARNGCDWKSDWALKFPTEQQKKELEVLSIDNHRRIMQYVRDNFSFRNLGIYICLSCGLRIGEICALTWDDVDVSEGVIMIRKTLERVSVIEGGERHTKLMLGTPKTRNSVRDIPMTRELLQVMKPLVKIVNPKYYVLSNAAKPLEPRTYRNYYMSLMKRIGVPALKFHGLRHSFATRCIESNCDYKTVSVLLGHSNIGTTLNLYVHPNLEQKKRCINKALKFMK